MIQFFGFPMIKVLLTIPRVLLSCILLTIFPVNLSVDKGQSIKCVIFHPQFSSSLAYSKSRIAFSGSSSKAGIPWKSLKSALRIKYYYPILKFRKAFYCQWYHHLKKLYMIWPGHKMLWLWIHTLDHIGEKTSSRILLRNSLYIKKYLSAEVKSFMGKRYLRIKKQVP